MRGPSTIEFRAEFSSIEGTITNHELTLIMGLVGGSGSRFGFFAAFVEAVPAFVEAMPQ